MILEIHHDYNLQKNTTLKLLTSIIHTTKPMLKLTKTSKTLWSMLKNQVNKSIRNLIEFRYCLGNQAYVINWFSDYWLLFFYTFSATQISKKDTTFFRYLIVSYGAICDVVRQINDSNAILLILLLLSFFQHLIVSPYYLISFWGKLVFW